MSLKQHTKKAIRELEEIKKQTESEEKRQSIEEEIQKLKKRLARMELPKSPEEILLIRHLQKTVEKYSKTLSETKTETR